MTSLKPIVASVITSLSMTLFRDYTYFPSVLNSTLSALNISSFDALDYFHNPQDRTEVYALFTLFVSMAILYSLVKPKTTPPRNPIYFAQGGDGITMNVEPVNGEVDSGHDLNSVIPATSSNQIVTSLQTQVAPNLAELSTLHSEVMTKIYSTPMYVGNYVYNTSNVIGDSLAHIGSNISFTNNNIIRLFRDYRFCSFDQRFTINVTGNPQSSGLMLAAVRPIKQPVPTSYLAQAPGTTVPASLLLSTISLPHIIIDISVDGTYTIDMPYTHFNSSISAFGYTASPPWAYLEIIALTQLQVPSGTSTILNFQVYNSIMNLKHLETMHYLAQGLFSFGEKHTVINNMGPTISGNPITQGLGSLLSQLSAFRSAPLPSVIMGDSVSVEAKLPFGLDNPSDTTNHESFLRKAYQKVCSSVNVLDVFRYSSDPSKMIAINSAMKKDLRIDSDEMDFEFYCNRWNFAGNFFTDVTTPIGTLLFSTPIIPNSYVAGGSSYQDLSTFYQYWRGTMKYRLLIASNKFKQSKILIAIHYGVPSLTSITTGAIDPRSVPHIIIDTSNNDRYVDIEVPFKSVHEFLRLSTNRVNPIGLSPQGEFSLGTIAIYLVSSTAVGAGIPSTTNFVVFNAWSSDMRFYQDHNKRTTFAQSSLSAPGPTSISNRLGAMMYCKSLKELLLKPVFIGNYSCLQSNIANYPNVPFVMPIHPTFLTNSAEWSFIMSMFAGAHGSLRVIVRYLTGSYPIRVTYLPYLNVPGTVTLTNYQSLTDAQSFNYNIPEYPYPDSTTPRIQTDQTTQMISGAPVLQMTAIGANQEYILDANSQPEAIVELPDSSIMFRTMPTTLLPPAYSFNTTVGSYTPRLDRNIPYLVISTTENGPNPGGIPIANTPDAIFSLHVVAGDDFRAYWYNGGPTNSFYPTTLAGSTPIPDIRSLV